MNMQRTKLGNLKFAAAVAITLSVATGVAQAVPITFTGSGTGPGSVPVAASAIFDISDNTLTITLQNTSPSNSGEDVPGSTLSGLFWDFTGNPTLTPVSATIPSGSSIIQPGTCSSGACTGAADVGGEWGYGTTVKESDTDNTPKPIPGGADRGISSSGYLTTGLTGNIGNFNNGAAGTNLDNPNSLDGINLGIVSAASGFNPNGGLNSVPLIKDTVVFVLFGVSGLTTANISHVSFQYGTALSELNIPGVCTQDCGSTPPTDIPEPTTVALLGLGMLALSAIRRRKVT